MIEKNILIYEKDSIKHALKKLDKCIDKVLLVIDDANVLLGTITDGDVRRYILKGQGIESNVREVYNKNPAYLSNEGFSLEYAKDLIIRHKVTLLPVLDSEKKLIDCLKGRDLFSEGELMKIKAPCRNMDIPVVIMAGGKSTRMEPFSRIFPKPLIPIGDKPIIQIIIDEFKSQGVRNYYLTLNYKGEMIESYFNHLEKDFKVHYIWEKVFCGTAGSLKLLEKEIPDTFIVSNCDVIVKADFEEVIGFHKRHNAFLTLLSSIQHYKIPYGIVNFKERGEVINVIEKPEYTFTINTGVYVLNRESIKLIPEGTYFDMPDLIKILIENNKKVLTYPVNENEYIDIGQWEEYKKNIVKLL